MHNVKEKWDQMLSFTWYYSAMFFVQYDKPPVYIVPIIETLDHFYISGSPMRLLQCLCFWNMSH